MALVAGNKNPHESIKIEYKKYVHRPETFNATISRSRFLVDIDPHEYNKIAAANIRENIMKFLPKYLALFANTEVRGTMYLGINDGTVTEGIPYFGRIDRDVISRAIADCARTLQLRPGRQLRRTIENYVSFRVYKLCVPKKYLQAGRSAITSFVKRQSAKFRIWRKYRHKYQAWHKRLIKYHSKLQCYVNDSAMRCEAARYIWSKFPSAMYLLWMLIVTGVCMGNPWLTAWVFVWANGRATAIVQALVEWMTIREIASDIGRFAVRTRFSLGRMREKNEIFNDDSSSLRWLLEYRDLKLLYLLSQKPAKPIIDHPAHRFEVLISDVGHMSHPMHARGADFYLLKFNVHFPHGTRLAYVDHKSHMMVAKRRYMDANNGPASV